MDSDGRLIVYFSDGSVMKNNFTDSSREWIFYHKNFEKCDEFDANGLGRYSFLFIYYQSKAPTVNENNGPDWEYHLDKGFEPYKYAWDGQLSSLYGKCLANSTTSQNDRKYCTTIIQYNGWKIPKNYPLRISY